MAPPPRKASVSSPAARFRAEIEAAVAEGVPVEDMTLRLTLSDASRLTRDPTTPLADISYADGVMRYLGVQVAQGGVPASSLDRGEG